MLFQKKEELQQAKAEDAVRYHTIELADPSYLCLFSTPGLH